MVIQRKTQWICEFCHSLQFVSGCSLRPLFYSSSLYIRSTCPSQNPSVIRFRFTDLRPHVLYSIRFDISLPSSDVPVSPFTMFLHSKTLLRLFCMHIYPFQYTLPIMLNPNLLARLYPHFTFRSFVRLFVLPLVFCRSPPSLYFEPY